VGLRGPRRPGFGCFAARLSKMPQKSFLIRDNDGAFGEAFTRRLRAMGIRDRPIAPRSPWQNGYVERSIGSIRRECLHHVIIWGEAHLRQVLKAYTAYYNATRGLISALTLQTVGQSRGAASSSLMPCWADFTIATRGYSFRKGQGSKSLPSSKLGLMP
jgi:transposase InsO family protein